jgi:uncharacterized DUF497 family protein
MRPRILREFFEKYPGAKFPNDVIAANVLKGLSIPSNRAETALKIVKENGRCAGIIRDTPTGPFVSLDTPGVPAPGGTPATVEEEEEWTDKSKPRLHLSRQELFRDPLATTFPDPDHSLNEHREITIGHTMEGHLIFVAHSERGGKIRIISARLATATERKKV